ncbi:hypothetical protein RUMTOR_00944 [[Ruminococcus] torques ATCC 27756]|uniref:Uncharacterized protein n=1 Tax=[Ruminococcus] torques ATCC 27756 TaxID=411460 RepID=A5KL40_9FIRM|nr:hypothetical protein RUMTOR_00944 [[Ruminococcus] torques ATCC 27756]
MKVKSLQFGIACFKCKKADSSLHIDVTKEAFL